MDDKGLFYRNEEMRSRFADPDYNKKVQGAYYFNYMMPGMGSTSFFADGNVFGPENQPGEFYAKLKDAEKEVLDSYGIQTWNGMFRTPDMDRAAYYPLWTGKMTSGSAEEIAAQKVTDGLRVMDKPSPMPLFSLVKEASNCRNGRKISSNRRSNRSDPWIRPSTDSTFRGRRSEVSASHGLYWK